MALAALLPILAPAVLPEGLPCRTANGRVYVRARAGEALGWWLVDTGATHTVVSPRTAHGWPRAVGVPREADAYGLSGWAVPPLIRLGGQALRLGRAAILPRLSERFLAEDEVFISGILGWDALGQGRWRLDPARNTVHVMASASRRPAEVKHHWPLEARHGSPVLRLRHASGRQWAMLLDTGTDALLLRASEARLAGWQGAEQAQAGARLQGLASAQPSWSWKTRLDSRGPLSALQTILVAARAPMDWVDGVLGTGFLSGRTLWWDGPSGWWGLSGTGPHRPPGRDPA
ncbi:MAG: hypothetical protein VKO64_07975 [Candidatus Sericytochromatia bacterium]|nr:hypothetical protein [Candidatus Sericytochromatia bacterium]